MQTENIPTLRIHKLTQAQYDAQLSKGNIRENELYLTPCEMQNPSKYATKDYVSTSLNSIYNMVYPIGSIYTSVNSANPSIFFGGIWEEIENIFLTSGEELSVYAFKRIN